MESETKKILLRENLKSYVESITRKSKGTNMYVCPLCGSGSGKHGTGAFSIKDGVSWKCFSCNESGDIFDLIGKVHGIQDYSEQMKKANELFGESTVNKSENNEHTHISIHTQDEEADYSNFFLQANKDIEKTDYWKKRGLSKDTVNRFKLGYVEEWRHPKAPTAPTTPRLIIPTSKGSYLARDTRADIPEEQKPYSKSKVGSIQLFNKRALKEAEKPVFIVEGELDALSIIEVGGEAVALGSTTNTKALAELLKVQKPSKPLIIALDNDKAGQNASEELADSLKELGISFYRLNPYGEYKDANEALLQDREAFKRAIAEIPEAEADGSKAERENYKKNAVSNFIYSFMDEIYGKAGTPYIPTGFKNLDEALDGGLYEGLYILGAISSLGKTTFIIQMADQIASSGRDVIIVSLEMSKFEIVSKSISRETLSEILRNGGSTKNAKTSRGITTHSRYENYSSDEINLIGKAIENYGKHADKLYIFEGIGDIGAEQVRKMVDDHIRFTGNAPVLVIDYIQILAPYSDRATEKQNTDKTVLELKRISRDYKIPVIGISSFNRASYNSGVSMEAFKESGAIEYSSDVLFGLQLKGVGESNFNVTEAKRKDPREVELLVLKNRNGRTGDKLTFKYYPMFNYFQADEEKKER